MARSLLTLVVALGLAALADRNKALAAELADSFVEWPETVWVMTSYGLDSLAERALYYVDADTLYEWNELAEEALEREDTGLLEELDELEPWVDIDGPPQPDQIPEWLAATLVLKDGSIGKSGIIYVPLRGSNAQAMEQLSAWLDQLREAHPDVTFASAAALLGEVTPALIADSPWIVALVFLGLIIATAVASRSFVVTRDVFLVASLRSLGEVGVIGLGISLAVNLLWLRAWCVPNQPEEAA